MGLDQRGKIAVAQLVIYIPFLAISTILVLRHGFTRRAGWLLLLIVSIVRIVGSAIHIASDERSTPSTGLITAYITLEAVGLSPLLMATLGFLRTVSQYAFEKDPLVLRGLGLMSILGIVALALSIASGAELGSAHTQDDVNSAATLRHASAILFGVLYVLIVLTHMYFYMGLVSIREHRRKLLYGISLALPFLLVRVIYAILSGFSPVGIPGGPPPNHNALSKFSSQTGEWGIYLVMSVLMEIAVMVVYMVVGLTIRLQDDEKDDRYGGSQEYENQMPMGRRRGTGYEYARR